MAFITLEGSEGVGKSTALEFIKNHLLAQNIDYVLSREPGGTPMAEKIRAVLLEDYAEKVAAETEALLLFAGRAQNINNVIKPALAQNKWVVCDRFTDASYAYQGGGRGVNLEFLDNLAAVVQADLEPDLTLLLDAPVEVGMARISKRQGKADRIEQEAIEFFQRVRQAYLNRALLYPKRYVVIDATQEIAAVQTDIKTAIARL